MNDSQQLKRGPVAPFNPNPNCKEQKGVKSTLDPYSIQMFLLIRLFFIMSCFISLLIQRSIHQGSRVDASFSKLVRK